jgi:hypothetical protein
MKKYLLAYQINNKTVGIDIQQWNGEDLNGKEPFKIILSGETIPNNYVNISSILNWDQFGEISANDYMVVRFEIRDLCKNKGWENLNNFEKDIAIKHYITDNPTNEVIYMMTVKGMSQLQAQGYLLQSWHKYHAKLIHATKQRFYYSKLVIPQYLSLTDSEKLFDYAKDLIYDFTTLGRFGIMIGDKNDGLLDYLMSTNGFVGKGMKESGLSLVQGTWDGFINQLSLVLVDGIYSKYDDYNF